MASKEQIGDRMAEAIAEAMPRIIDMWGAFPYAEQDGDDEAIYELQRAAKAWLDAKETTP